MAGILLVIARQTPLLHQPAEAALNDPASGQHDEALLVFELLDDAQAKARAVAEEPAHALHELLKLPGITTIGEDHQQVQEAVAEQAQEQLRAIAVLHACRGDHHAEHESIGVGEHMAFAALDLLARIVTAAQRRKLPAFDALAVNDSGAGHGVFFSIRRVLVRNASLMRGHSPCWVQEERASCTVLLGANSLGKSDHWQPVLST